MCAYWLTVIVGHFILSQSCDSVVVLVTLAHEAFYALCIGCWKSQMGSHIIALEPGYFGN